MLINTPFKITKKGRATFVSFQSWPICSIKVKNKDIIIYNMANGTPNIGLYLLHLEHYLHIEGYNTTRNE